MSKQTILNLGRRSAFAGILIAALSLTALSFGDEAPGLIDDFSDAAKTSGGVDRFVIDDASVGGSSAMRQSFEDGVLSAEGEIVPARGQPGWVSMAFGLAPMGQTVDMSQYEGVKIRIRVKSGNVSLSVNSSEVTNFDYHTMAIPRTGDAFKEVRIPFKDMKRMWSEQTKLNPATIQSVSLVAADLQKGSFVYDVDEVSFY